jgi:CheY-like chemotaxis protein
MSANNSIDTGAITTRLRALSTEAALKILVVEDDELARALISDRLEQRGFLVSQAADGGEALQLLERQSFPVVLVDWTMPVMDGIELTQHLRNLGMQDTYVVMLTGKDEDLDFERGYLAGVDDFLSKRVREVELLARIHAAFTTYSLRCELRETRAELAAARGR